MYNILVFGKFKLPITYIIYLIIILSMSSDDNIILIITFEIAAV